MQASVRLLAYVFSLRFSTTNDMSITYDQKCNMDREVPEDNKESTQDSIDNTKKLIHYIRSLTQTSDSALVQPILTPRFAISCTPELLRSLGDIADSDPSLRIQAHISENLDEVATVGELFPGNTSYADVYDYFGLLGPKTILGHAVHLGDDEVKLIAERKAGISHCPTSNFNLTSGIAQVGKYLDAGIKVRILVHVILMFIEFDRALVGWLGDRCCWRICPLDSPCHPRCEYSLQGAFNAIEPQRTAQTGI